MRVLQIGIKGYRSLADVTLPLQGLNVLIGPNGSGKTSLLEVFQLLALAMQERLRKTLEQRGGFNAILPRIADEPARLEIGLLAVDVENKQSQEETHYQFELAPRGVGYVIAGEQLERKQHPDADNAYQYIDAQPGHIRYNTAAIDEFWARWAEPTENYHADELALAQMPRIFPEPEALRSSLSKTTTLSFLDVGLRAVVRLPQSLTPSTRPGPNGENLFSALYNLRAMHRKVYDRLQEYLGLGFPGFQELEFPVVGSGQVTLTWQQEGLTSPLFVSELSEGTLRFLWLATVLLSPEPSPITLIDEPEISLHPELLKLLAELLQDAASRGQLLVATHSSDLVRWLQPEEVVVLDKEEGRTCITRAADMDLGAWLKEYSLNELWLMGTLGGRP